MKALDRFLNNKGELQMLKETNLKTHLYKAKLKKNPPFTSASLAQKFANASQLKDSYERKKKNHELIAPYSQDCYFDFNDLDSVIKDRVVESDFWRYTEEVVLDKGLYIIKLGNAEKRLSYGSELVIPITSLPGDIKDVGLKVFRLIFKICKDRDRIFLPHLKIRRLIEILYNNPVEIKDECFFQMIKQIRLNPFQANNVNEWKLLAIVSSFVSPSENFIYFFLNYIYNVYLKTANDNLKQWIKYIFKSILQTNEKSERFVLPCVEELKSIEERRKVPIEIYFPNGSSEIFFFESYSTIGELKHDIIDKYEFSKEKAGYYGIYEYCQKEHTFEENYIDDKIKVLDVVGSWSNEIDFLNLKAEKKGDSNFVQYRLYFQIRFFFESDLAQDNVLKYYQCMYRFMKNRFNVDYETYIRLMGLRLRVDFGLPNTTKLDHIRLNFKRESPPLDYDAMSAEEIDRIKFDVENEYKAQDIEVLEAQSKFLEILKANPLYFSEIFPVKLYEREDQENQNLFNLPHDLFIALRYDKVLLLSSNFVVIKSFNFSEVMKWGFSSELFILIISKDEMEMPIKISFKSKMASNIVYSLNTFINVKMGKEPEPNSLTVNENVTREIYKNKFFKKVNIFKVRKVTFELD